METLQDNLKCDIRKLVEKYQHQKITLSDINVKIPETLKNILAILEESDFSISNSITSQRRYPVFINGVKTNYTEAQIAKLRNKNNADVFLDLPRQTLAVHLPDFNKELDFQKLPYASQKIMTFGITNPGDVLNQDKHWYGDTLKRYIFTTRQLLGGNNGHHIIRTSKGGTLPPGSYYFNPGLNYIVIKNPKSTLNPPSINKSDLE